MDYINTLAGIFGISGTELIIVGIVALVLVAGWVAIRAAMKIAFRVFALGCVTILGIALALWVLFVLIK